MCVFANIGVIHVYVMNINVFTYFVTECKQMHTLVESGRNAGVLYDDAPFEFLNAVLEGNATIDGRCATFLNGDLS